MNAVAAAAGIRTGTRIAGFGEMTHLPPTLLDHREQQFPDAFLHGSAQLRAGPRRPNGCAPFPHAFFDHFAGQQTAMPAAEAPRPWPATPAPPARPGASTIRRGSL